MKTELLHGTLDVLILKTLSWGPMHGFGVGRWIERLSGGELHIEEGSLYPALYRLESKGWIDSSWGLSENGRRARFYRLTPKGRRQLLTSASTWTTFARAVARVLNANKSLRREQSRDLPELDRKGLPVAATLRPGTEVDAADLETEGQAATSATTPRPPGSPAVPVAADTPEALWRGFGLAVRGSGADAQTVAASSGRDEGSSLSGIAPGGHMGLLGSAGGVRRSAARSIGLARCQNAEK